MTREIMVVDDDTDLRTALHDILMARAGRSYPPKTGSKQSKWLLKEIST